MTSVHSKHPRTGRRSFASALAMLLALCAPPALAGSWVVTTGTDGPQKAGDTSGCHEVTAPGSLTTTGFCSLRAAIELSNNLSGSHTITFSPSVLAVTVVNGALDTLMAPITITGTPITRTVLDGGGHGCFNLTDSGTVALNHGSGATGSTIANMVIGNCGGYGISANGHSYIFTNNFIGINSGGTAAFANTQDGIYLSASAVYDDSVIGTQPLLDLYHSLPAQPVDDTQIATFKSTLLTALSSLSPNLITGNVISGNTGNGITISSQNLAATIVTGNFIGTDPTGNTAIANGGSGVRFIGGAFANLVSGNTISGNALHGIEVDSDVFLPNWIMGNRIGLPTLNGMHVGNGMSGIYVSTYPATSGHANPSGVALVIGPANVIADNQGANNNAFPDLLGSNGGIVVTSPSQGIKLLGNRIGIPEFPAGTPVATTDYGNKGDGIIITVSGIKIGGSGATDGNVIAGNARHGIVVSGSATSATSILGNSIGVDPMLNGNLGIGNGVDGIHIDAANSTTIGGTGSSDFNTVAGNGRNGIKIRNGNFSNGWSNASQRNLVYHNATTQPPLQFGHDGVGIDLDYAEDAANSLHGEYLGPSYSYANFDQAQPVICAGPADTGKCSGSLAPSSSGGNTTLQWTIATHGPAQFRMDFFRIDTADDNTASSMTFIGEQSISSVASIYPAASYPADSAACSGGVCTVTLPASAGGGYIIMTATDVTPLTNAAAVTGDWKDNLKCFIGDLGVVLSSCPVNNTSEFSNVASVPGAAPTVVTNAASAITKTTATLNATISANGADTGTSFEYGADTTYGSTSNGAPITVTAAQSNIGVIANISSLTCGTTYHFRADAANNNGQTLGNDLTFTTAPCAASLPTAATVAASAISATGATLNGTVSANGATTTVSFDYGATASYGSNVTATQSPLSSGSISSPVSYVLSGLTCNTTYHFRVNAINDGVTTIHGGDLSFTTAVCAPIAPTVTTVAASGISASGATLNGTVSANGAIATVTFDFGTTTAYGAIGSPAAAAQSPLSSGASGAAVSLALSGLACNTTYHFRANANNGVGGTINGGDLQFTTGACVQPPPSAITTAASAIAATSATLNGLVSANGASTAVTFDYGPTAAYGGSGSPGTAAQSPLAAGSGSNTAVTFALAGLTCGTTYHFRVNATNTGGTVQGTDTTFSTASCAASSPSVATNPASGITTTSAVLNGTVSANGAATTVTFDFGLTSSYGGAGSPGTAAQSPLSSGASGAPVTYALSGLTCATTYHFRANASNGVGGTINGGDQQFTTAVCPGTPPTANTGSASSITTSGATLNGTVSANGAQTAVTFEYGTTTSYGLSAAASQSPLASGSSANAPVSAALTGLNCGTQYHFRVDANNGTGGTIHGNDATFTTTACPVQPPGATTDAASAVTATSATLNATVSANGAATTVSFDYGTTTAYGSTAVASQSPLAASASNAAVSADIGSLTCNQLYHFRVNADNGSAGGPVSGVDQTFTTAACPAQPPTATTDAASAVTATSATLNATVSANGTATTVSFDYGTTIAYGSNMAAVESPLAANASNAAVSANVSSLSCNQLYHFRVSADNGSAGGPVYGSDQTFTTAACASQAPTATSLAATAIGTTSATLNGTVNANGATTTVSFAYGADANYGSTIAATPASLPANAVGTAVAATLSGLTCATTYHFRVDATNTNGTGHGGDLSLTTAACPVTTFTGPTATGTGSATAVLSGGGPSCSLVSPAFIAVPGPAPAGVSFPDGLFQFQASGCTGSVTLTVTFPTAFAAGVQYWKYGPTSGQASDHWYTLGAANSLSLVGHVATFTIADGGLGDDDLSVNGTIIDAGGPSLAAVAPQPATPAPILDPRNLAALIALLALFGAAAMCTQRKAGP